MAQLEYAMTVSFSYAGAGQAPMVVQEILTPVPDQSAFGYKEKLTVIPNA
jgi:hypothetical protein